MVESLPTEVPAPTSHEVAACAFEAWADSFRAHGFKHRVVPLPMEFVEYLKEDGLFLPDNSAAEADEEPWSDEEQPARVSVPAFTELKAVITQAIAALGGEVMPKLNWSAPKDAVWVSSVGSMKCTNADEVILLLKASDAIAHDLCHAFDNCGDAVDADAAPAPALVLKKWYDLAPSTEFRCFVRRGEWVGACQRDTTHRYGFLLDAREQLDDTLQEFFEAHVLETFALDSYVYDVHVTASRRVKIMDFNPWGGATIPLLFEWAELEAAAHAAARAAAAASGGAAPRRAAGAAAGAAAETEEGRAEFVAELRLIEDEQMIRPGLRTGVPLDLYDSSDAGALKQFLNRCEEQRRGEGGEQDEGQDDEDSCA